MKKSTRTTLLVITILTLIMASLACNLPGLNGGEPTPTPIPVSTEAVQSMATQVLQAATQAATGGAITLVFTEQQLTSAAALELQGQTEYDVTNVQVRLRNGLITISGEVSQSGFNLPMEISMRVTPNAQGQPQADVVEASVGPLPLPDSMTSEIEQQFNTVIRNELSANGQSIIVDSITIADGSMTIQAHTQ